MLNVHTLSDFYKHAEYYNLQPICVTYGSKNNFHSNIIYQTRDIITVVLYFEKSFIYSIN